MEDNVKQALLDGSATIQTKIEIITDDNEENIILDEQNGVISWDYEDFRYVKDEGWIGQFVARQVNGVVKNVSDDFSMTDKEFILHMGVKIGDNTTWYSLGNFLVNKVTDDEVNDKTSFEALDYTKKFNQTYVDSITYPCTALELAQNVCEQCNCELGNTDFKHNDWEITGNVFTNGESCREVLKAISKLAYSWVRVDWNNKVYIDFIKNTEVNEYNEINNSNYYSLTTQKEKFGGVNRVIIGYKDIEGERTKVEDTESINANGVNEITIYDNPLVYNQELREKAIIGAEDLFGLEYLPLETLTVGHPWLKGYELVEVRDMEGDVHKTIPFDRTIQYFGHIKTKINVATNTKTNTEYAYESGIGGRLRKTEIMVDKINGQITEVIEEQTETTEKLNETISTVEETKQTISSVETTIEDIVTTTQTSTGGNSLYITDSLESNALEYHIEGKSEQETRSGRNLYNFEDTIVIGEGATVDKDGWITITYDNSTGTSTKFINYYTDNLNLKTSTDYNIVTEIKSVSGTGKLNVVSKYDKGGQFETTANYDLSNQSNNTIRSTVKTTKSSFEGVTQGLRTFAQFDAGQSGSITFRLSVLEDTTVTPDTFEYEQYGASPSPDYPSEIKTIPSIRNIFDGKVELGRINDITGEKYENQDTIINTNIINVKPNTTYIFSLNGVAITEQPRYFFYDKNKNLISSIVPTVGSIIETPDNCYYLNFHSSGLKTNYGTNLPNPMISETSTGYVPYGAWAKVKITDENLFDKDNINKLNVYVDVGNNLIVSNVNTKSFYIPIIGGNTYIISKTLGNRLRTATTTNIPSIGETVANQYNADNGINKIVVTTNKDAKYLIVTYTNLTIDTTITEQEILNSINVCTQEKEVLIDLSKPNLFNSSLFVQGTPYDNTSTTRTSAFIKKVVSGETFTIKSNNSNLVFAIGFSTLNTQNGNTGINESGWVTDNQYTITSTKEGYLWVNIRYSNNSTITPSDIKEDDFIIYEGYTDYYELSSIDDFKNKLEAVSGKFTNKIYRVILNGSEDWKYWDNAGYTGDDLNTRAIYLPRSFFGNAIPDFVNVGKNISSHFSKINGTVWNINKNAIAINPTVSNCLQIRLSKEIVGFTDDNTNAEILALFKVYLKEQYDRGTPITIDYILETPQQITLPNINIELFEGVNHISLIDDLETTTSIKYYRNTPIAQDYVVQQQLDKTNDNLANTTNKTNQNESDINLTNTNLNNNYYTKPQIDVINSATSQEITTIKKEVETKVTAEDLTIAINQVKTTSASSVETSTGYKFNENGLSIKKSDSEMSSLLDNDGLVVKRDTTEVLTVRSSGVQTENLTVRTYFTIGDNTRAENYKGGTGFFYIGGDN